MAASRLGSAAAWLAETPGQRFRLVLLVLYGLHLATGLAQHAMWRDEVQAWLIVRDSPSLADLARHLAYEGHPLGWYLLLWPLKIFGTSVELVKVAQGACAAAVAALLLWRGPFGRIELVLLLSSYPFLFEYAVKSRSYVLGCLVLFLFCVAFIQRRPVWMLAALVALLWNIHVLFGLVATGCVAAILARRATEEGFRGLVRLADLWPALIVVSGVACAALVATPPPDGGFAVGWNFDLGRNHLRTTFLTTAALVFGQSVNPLIDLLKSLFAVGVIAIALARWKRVPEAAAFMAAALAATITFIHVKYGTNPWHSTILFVTVVAAVWIARGSGGSAGPALLPRWLFLALLTAQAAGGLRAAVNDRLVPFSAGRDVATALRAAGLEHARLFAIDDAAAATVVGYLGSPSAFYGPAMREGSFVVWDQKRLAPVDIPALVSLAAAQPDALVLKCGDPAPATPPHDPRLREWARFGGRQEACVVYTVDR